MLPPPTDDNQSEVINPFSSTSRYGQSYLPFKLQLNKANVSDTEASFLDSHLSISAGFY